MDYIELTVSTTTKGSEWISSLLCQHGAQGTQIIDRSDLPPLDKPGKYWELMDESVLEAMPIDVQVKAWFELNEQTRTTLATLSEALSQARAKDSEDFLGTLTLSTTDVQEKDWAECWKEYYKPLRIGKSIVIKPTWESYEKQEGDLIIELDPGMAFGTGTHETTEMCVTLIEKYYRGGTMLDVGTGSGILSIAAAKLGATDVCGVDIDELAVKVAKENVTQNNLDDRITIIQGDLLQGLDKTFDVIVANILAPVICMLCPALKNHHKKGGLFICSGIIIDAKDDVLSALQQANYTIMEVIQKGDWVAIVAKG